MAAPGGCRLAGWLASSWLASGRPTAGRLAGLAWPGLVLSGRVYLIWLASWLDSPKKMFFVFVGYFGQAGDDFVPAHQHSGVMENGCPRTFEVNWLICLVCIGILRLEAADFVLN